MCVSPLRVCYCCWLGLPPRSSSTPVAAWAWQEKLVEVHEWNRVHRPSSWIEFLSAPIHSPLSGSTLQSFSIVYPHIGDFMNLAGYPPLKPNIIFCDYLLDHKLSLRMDHQFKEDQWCQDWRFEVSFWRKKYFWHLPYLYHLFARGRANV
jgi:hypothetical protein